MQSSRESLSRTGKDNGFGARKFIPDEETSFSSVFSRIGSVIVEGENIGRGS